jgi:uncharacterized protein (DUF362 family)
MIFQRPADDIIEAAYDVTAELLEILPPEKPVIIKPNIVEPSLPPVTTDVQVVAGIIAALEESGVDNIMVAEGSGTGDTDDNFRKLGYTDLEIELIDLDKTKTIALPVKNYRVWDKIIIPEILLDKFIISVPVLKEHSLCGITASLKNMIGILPAKYYSGYWTYKKSQVHKYDTHSCIADLTSIIRPDLAIVDATVGMKGHHLSGTPIEPSLNLVYGSDDMLEADIFGCELLGRDWGAISYLHMIAEDTKKGLAP